MKQFNLKRLIFLAFKNIVLTFRHLFSRKRCNFLQDNLKKILVVRTERLGDFILALPAIKTLKKAYPFSQISVMVNAYMEEFVRDINVFDEVLVYDKKFTWLKKLGFLKMLRSKHFDMSVDLTYGDTVDAALLLFFTGIPMRVGYDVHIHGWLYTHPVLPSSTDKYEVEYALDIVRSLGIKEEINDISFKVSKEAEKYAENFWNKNRISSEEMVIGVSPGTSSTVFFKSWPKEKFVQLANKIMEEFSIKVMFFGAPEEKNMLEEMANLIKKRPIIFTDASISQLCGAIKKITLLICNNSGAMNVAAALNIPTVVINGPSSINRWTPKEIIHSVISKHLPCSIVDCSNCYRGDYACIKDIAVEDVWVAVKDNIYNLTKKN